VTWLVDPDTREMLPAVPSKERELTYAQTHWRTGWRSGTERDEDGQAVRIWFAQCPDDCCAEYRANLPSLESLR